ncbi:MAG: metal ABC transporter substrate-binding protein [Planctomycetota bacterium]
MMAYVKSRVFGVLAAVLLAAGVHAAPLPVVVSSTDVATIVEAVGGDAVAVTSLVKGTEDAHVVEPTRRMVESLARSDLVVVVGLGLEEAWLPGMLAQTRRSEIAPGGERYLDLSTNMRTIAGPEGRGVPGSFHPEDNPHFLVDPVEGVKAAAAVAAKLSELVPQKAEQFDQGYRAFAEAIMVELLGEALAEAHTAEEFEELAIAIERGELEQHLAAKGVGDLALGGRLADFETYRDVPVVGDHDYWPYFARRYGVRVLGYLEVEPGVPPTTPHLQRVITEMKDRDARVILTLPYFDPRHARFVADATDAIIVPMAHTPESLPNTETYLEWVLYNEKALLEALKQTRSPAAADTP